MKNEKTLKNKIRYAILISTLVGSASFKWEIKGSNPTKHKEMIMAIVILSLKLKLKHFLTIKIGIRNKTRLWIKNEIIKNLSDLLGFTSINE